MKKSLLGGYVRVSSEDQNPEWQLDDVKVDKLFTDKVSGKSIHFPGLEALPGYIREGDILLVHSMDRLAHNHDDLRLLIQNLTIKGITISFKKEGVNI